MILPRDPGLYILDTGLGEYERHPTWVWEVYGPDLVQGFKYSLNGSVVWTEVDESVRSYQPDSPLEPGEYTLRLQAKSLSGIWSRTVSATARVSLAGSFTPNDLYFLETNGQWALERIRMQELWGYIKEAELDAPRSEVVVAVVDTGYTAHPDVIGNILYEQGYDFVKANTGSAIDPRDGDSIDPDATDEGDGILPSGPHSWHGTGVAGVIAAVTDNDVGIAGIGLSNLKVLPVRALASGGGSTYDIAQAILYAAGLENDSGITPTKPAKLINLSVGAYINGDPYVDEALRLATDEGCIVVASAGNERLDFYGEVYKTEVAYPASSSYTIAVGAITFENDWAPYSNPGTLLDIMAPGGSAETSTEKDWVMITSADPNGLEPSFDYLLSSGTSIAAPHVTGILALLCTLDDTMDLAIGKEVLRRSAKDLGVPGWDKDFGYGLVDGFTAAGAYRLLLDTRWTPSVFTSRAVGEVPDPDVDPDGELADGSLIVRYVTDASAKSVGSLALIMSVGADTVGAPAGRDRLVQPRPGSDIKTLRKALIAEETVEAVFYNYRYRIM